MKKIYLTLALGVLALGVNAQQKVATKFVENHSASYTGLNNPAASKTAATATLVPSTLQSGGCGTSTTGIAYYALQSQGTTTITGYAFGTNIIYYPQGGTTYTLTISRAAQKYFVVGTATISGVVVLSAKHSSTAGTSMITAKIYSENSTSKAPSTVVGSAATKALNTFTGNDQITFATPVVVPAGNFFACIESPTIGGATKDTLAIYSTVQGCSSSDSLSWQYQQQVGSSGGLWTSVASGDNTVNLDLLIFPVADVGPSTVGINSISKGDLTLLAAFPNPANNEVNINFGLSQDSKVDITLYDVAGKEISTLTTEVLSAGNHSQPINVSALSSGVYMYSIKSKGGQLFSKLTIAK